MKKNIKRIILFICVFALYLGVGSIVPFVQQPKVSEKTVLDYQNTTFMTDELGYERASVLENNGDALKERIRLISQAKEKIVLSTFEFRSDKSGLDVLSALINAAQRGVKVQVLIDGMSSMLRLTGNDYFVALSSLENAEIKIYNSINFIKPWNFMGRMHDKYLVVDNQAYILGGRNNYDYFLGNHDGYKNYDWDMFVYQTKPNQQNSLHQVLEYFESVWKLPYCDLYKDDVDLQNRKGVKDATKELKERYQTLQVEHKDWFEKIDYVDMTQPTHHIEIVTNPIHRYAKEPVVFYKMTELMSNAQQEVKFHTPYIIANNYMYGRIQEICSRVPQTMMMTNSVVNNGNPFGSMDYDWHKKKLLQTGLNIQEYDGGISYHGKCFTIDNRLSAIGSFNWDMRSTYLDTEMMVIVDSQEINQELKHKMKIYEEDALKVKDVQTYDLKENQVPQKMPIFQKLKLLLMRIFIGWLRFLM